MTTASAKTAGPANAGSRTEAFEKGASGEAHEERIFDIETLTPEVGWMLIGVGVLGVILPGLPGAPFFLAGGAVLIPGAKQQVTKWIGKNPGPMTRRSLAQLGRFMDDLERRYPRRIAD